MAFHYVALSYLHFIFAFGVFGALLAQSWLLRLPVDARAADLLGRIDRMYGLAAVLVILAGVSRVLWGEKGAGYYIAEPFFLAKMATFGIIALISIRPTITFIRWRKAAAADPAFTVPAQDAARMRTLVRVELLLFALLPLFAALMARGVGMGG